MSEIETSGDLAQRQLLDVDGAEDFVATLDGTGGLPKELLKGVLSHGSLPAKCHSFSVETGGSMPRRPRALQARNISRSGENPGTNAGILAALP